MLRYNDIKHLIEAGLHVFPCRATKEPCCLWKQPYQWSPTETCEAVGMACGNGLEVIDIDNPNLFEQVPKMGTVIARTQSGGYHLIYKTPEPGANTKLAMSYQRVEGPGEYGFDWRPGKLYKAREYADGWYISTAAIETRGAGGYILINPSPGYELLSGSLTDIPMLTTEQRDKLFFHCQALGEHPPAPKAVSNHRPVTGTRPGDAFNASVTIDDLTGLLVKHGWTCTGNVGSNRHFARPGKASGTSATLGGSGDFPLFYVFSSSAAPFDAEKAYQPFQVFAHLEHNGDFTAAASGLARAGFGEAERDPSIELVTHEDACAMPGIETPCYSIPSESLIELGMNGLK
ncbi:MAG: bifunctional DNA primase/polymerase, partial [Desulfatirhabdiaceae bacterium]